MRSRKERRALNEATFRAGNEAIVKNVRASTGMLSLICECGASDCVETIQLTPGEYEMVRAQPTRFAVLPGHEDEEETVVDTFDRFTLVDKTGQGAAIVRETDPRH